MQRRARTTETPGHVSGVRPMGTLPKPVSEVTNVGGARCATQARCTHSKHSSTSVCLRAAAAIANSREAADPARRSLSSGGPRRRAAVHAAASLRASTGLQNGEAREAGKAQRCEHRDRGAVQYA